MSSTDKVAIVTGASSGIGSKICERLVNEGYTVAGLARRVERVEELSKMLTNLPGKLHGFRCNLSNDDEVATTFSRVVETFGPVWVCVNSAGFSDGSSLLEGNPAQWRAMVDVNVVGLCHLTKLAVQNMRAELTPGHIVHISSLGGHQINEIKAMHFSAATKHAVRALAEGLRMELREEKSSIKVSCISPGVVQTEFADKILGAEKAAVFFSSIPHLEAEDVADTLMFVLNAPSHVEINDVLVRPKKMF